jgi:type IV secretion system protein VirD4
MEVELVVGQPLFDGVMRLGGWAQAHPWQVMGVMGGIPMLLGTVRLLAGRRRQSSPTTYGSARWATSREIKRAGLFERRGVILGQYGHHYLRHDGPEHVLLIGPTRSGKGVSTIIPTLLTWRESALVLDPKDGENYDVTAGWRPQFSDVHRFTPRRQPSTRMNVLDAVRLGTPMEFGDVQLISESLGAPEKMARENSTSLHFRELANLLRATAILHVLYTSIRKSLAGVWDFLTRQHKSLGECLKAMASTAHRSQGIHQAITSMTRAIQNITGDRELSSVWTTTIRPLVLYSDPLVAASTDASDMAIDDLQYGERPVSLYLIAPSPLELERLHPLYRVILDVAMTRLMEHKVRTWKYRLLNCFDELPWYGYTRAVDKGIAVQAGYGQKDLLVAQDLESLWEVYGTHTAIWGNCHVKVFHTPDNDLTAKRISENLMGSGTVETPVEQRSPLLATRRSVSLQHHGRPLMTTDELMDLPADQEIVRIGGIKPILAQKCDYRTDRNFAARLLPVS